MYKVMIVDDEPSVKRSLKNIIEYEMPAFQVTACADDGQEALVMMEQACPDLVITDIRMPVMDGLSLAESIRRREYPAEVVVISGYSDFGYAKQAIRHGVCEYLLKPLDVDEVTRMLGKIAEKFGNEQRGVAERSEWIAYCKSEAERMAKELWVLNDSAVRERLDALVQQLRRYPFHTGRMNELAVHFFSLLRAEIESLSGGRVQIEFSTDYEGNGRADALIAQIRQVLWETMEEIRQIRNWGSHKSIAEALKQIDIQYTNESFSLKDAAELAGMSPTYFSKSFKEETGYSYTQYIAKRRMEKAIELLSDPYNKVYEVAYAIGYSEYAHFAKVFKKYYGFSPTDYRHRLEA